MIDIKNRIEVFWDDYLIDTEKTTAAHELCHPVKQGYCHMFNNGLEKSRVSYPNILKTDDGYRMYYVTRYKHSEKGNLCVCESKDGLNWTSPDLNLFPYPEAEADGAPNNMVIKNLQDGFFVMYDTNPKCPPEKKYKAIGCVYIRDENGNELDRQLWCYTSPDGYHFSEPYLLTNDGYFDTLNILLYRNGKYCCYIRSDHLTRGPENTAPNGKTRDVKIIYSEDFETWTPAKEIEYFDNKDFQMYTNHIVPYERAPHILIGLPTRYCERVKWCENDDQFKSVKEKKSRIEIYKDLREGLALTDSMFMMSRDGEKFYRYNEAFLTPGLENEGNWIYGDCYFTYNMVEADDQNYYLYMIETPGIYGKKPLAYYKIRKDGFACIAAGGEAKQVVTKPFTFTGKDLHLNFSTSAFGNIYVDVLDGNGAPIEGATSFEIYGDTVDRRISFAGGGTFARFENTPIRLRFRMCEAKLYSMWFE